MDALSPDVFSDFYAVVLDHQFGGPLRWSPSHGAWLRRASSSTWAEEPVAGDEVDAQQQDAALAAVSEFLGLGQCERCWRAARAGSHFIAIDVYGAPVMYCVQMPAYDVVTSRGGTGSLKHWGSPWGCQAVSSRVKKRPVPGVAGSGIVSAYVYGEPLIADEALLMDWCTRCQRAARFSADSPTGDDSGRKEHVYRVESLARAVLERC